MPQLHIDDAQSTHGKVQMRSMRHCASWTNWRIENECSGCYTNSGVHKSRNTQRDEMLAGCYTNSGVHKSINTQRDEMLAGCYTNSGVHK